MKHTISYERGHLCKQCGACPIHAMAGLLDKSEAVKKAEATCSASRKEAK